MTARLPNVITPSAVGAKTYLECGQVSTGKFVLSRSKTTGISQKENQAKINEKCDICVKKQHSSYQTAQTAMP